MTDPVLQLDQITVRYKDRLALDGASFAVRHGEIHGILGENGAGKTSLMRILAGLLKPGSFEGQVWVEGAPVRIAGPSDAIKHGIGIVPRRPGIFSGLTIADNIVVGAWQHEKNFIINKQRTRDTAQHALDFVGLKLQPDAKATGLTPIQQRLLMISRACVEVPKVVVLDEPTSFLNTASELSQLFAVIRSLAARNIATLYMGRRPTEVLQIADRVSVLRDGQIVAEQPRSAFDETTLVREMMSRRVGDGSYVDYDDLNESKGGWLDGIRRLFTGYRE